MASAQVVETSVTNNSPSQDSNHPDDHLQWKKSDNDDNNNNIIILLFTIIKL